MILYMGVTCRRSTILYLVPIVSASHLTITFYEVDGYKIPSRSLPSLITDLDSNRLYRLALLVRRRRRRRRLRRGGTFSAFPCTYESVYARTRPASDMFAKFTADADAASYKHYARSSRWHEAVFPSCERGRDSTRSTRMKIREAGAGGTFGRLGDFWDVFQHLPIYVRWIFSRKELWDCHESISRYSLIRMQVI